MKITTHACPDPCGLKHIKYTSFVFQLVLKSSIIKPIMKGISDQMKWNVAAI
jgi:hypothetical protein